MLQARFDPFLNACGAQSNTPQQADGASNLQRSRAEGYLTLAAFAKYSCKHGTWLIAHGNETDADHRSTYVESVPAGTDLHAKKGVRS